MNCVVYDLMARVSDVSIAQQKLGEKNVITAEQALKLWSTNGLKTLSHEPDETIRYSIGILLSCLAQNRAQAADWRLIYILPISLLRQQQLIGVYPKHDYVFSGHNWWTHDQPELIWNRFSPEPGYWLIDFKDRWPHNEWQAQEKRIRDQRLYSRTNEAAYVQGLIGFAGIHDVRLDLRNESHWGPTKVGGEGRVLIDNFRREGVRVYSNTERNSEGRNNEYLCATHVTHVRDID